MPAIISQKMATNGESNNGWLKKIELVSFMFFLC